MAGIPLTYNQWAAPPPNPVRVPIKWGPNFYLAFVDPNKYTNPTFTLVSAPTNGILEYRSDLSNGRWLAVPLNTAINGPMEPGGRMHKPACRSRPGALPCPPGGRDERLLPLQGLAGPVSGRRSVLGAKRCLASACRS